jgi:DNA-binding transcriptional MerR regulator
VRSQTRIHAPDNSKFLPDSRCVSADARQRPQGHSSKIFERLDVHSFNSDSLSAHEVFWIASPAADDRSGSAAGAEKTEYTIAELAQEFGLTLRALRFYHSRGLISPHREGRRRVFSRADRDRLALIIKGKKLGFTLTEISQMIEAQSGRANAHTLKLNADKCLEQIAFFERQMHEAAEALTELREIHLTLSRQAMERDPKA